MQQMDMYILPKTAESAQSSSKTLPRLFARPYYPMPFHRHLRRSSSFDPPNNASLDSSHGAVDGMIQTAQTLGAVGTPSTSLRMANLGATSTDADGLFLPPARDGPGGAYNPFAVNRRNSDLIDLSSQSTSVMSNTVQPFESSRRATAVFGRQPEELHIPPANPTISNLTRQQSTRDYSTPSDVGPANVPAINVQPSSNQLGHYGAGSSSSGSLLPGALQPGNASRPPAVSANTAPSMLPTLPQLSAQSQQQSTAPRSVNSHGHSRSSPAGFDQPKYKHHGGTENSKYASSPGTSYPPYPSQGSKYSPLGLADIRPAGDLLPDANALSPGLRQFDAEPQIPTNSNYVAPWPMYAVDWCKWPIPGSTGSFGGKIAIGSYLEDNHNYVRTLSTTSFSSHF